MLQRLTDKTPYVDGLESRRFLSKNRANALDDVRRPVRLVLGCRQSLGPLGNIKVSHFHHQPDTRQIVGDARQRLLDLVCKHGGELRGHACTLNKREVLLTGPEGFGGRSSRTLLSPEFCRPALEKTVDAPVMHKQKKQNQPHDRKLIAPTERKCRDRIVPQIGVWTDFQPNKKRLPPLHASV